MLPEFARKSIYNAMYTSHMNYLINIWGDTTKKNISKLQRQQNKILKLIYKMDRMTPTTEIYRNTEELNIQQTITFKNLLLIYKIQKNLIKIGTKLTTTREAHSHRTRRVSHLRINTPKQRKYEKIPTADAIRTYNKILNTTKHLNYIQFRKQIKHKILHGEI